MGTTGEWACKGCMYMWTAYLGPGDPCPNCKGLGTAFAMDERTYDRWSPVINRMRELRKGEEMNKEETKESTIEIERKFLVGRIPGFVYGRCHLNHITQGYLAVSEGIEVRLRVNQSGSGLIPTVERRRQAAQYALEIKSGGSAGKALCRQESSVELTADQFEALDGLCTGVVDKARMHMLPEDDSGEKWTIDVYSDDLDGLVIAEVEFPSQDAAEDFEPPAWFGEEVTADPNFRTSAFACDPALKVYVLGMARDERIKNDIEEN